MKLEKMILNFLDYKKIYCSEYTYKYYFNLCKSLLNYFKDIDVFLLDDDKIKNYIIFCRNNNLSNSSINKRISLLKQLYKFNNLNLTFNYKKLKEKFVTYGCLSSNEFKKLLNIIPTLNVFYQSIFLIFIECGVRCNELIHIKTKNINFNERCIFLETTKTNKPRYVYFTKNTKNILLNYINLFPDVKKSYLFLSKTKREMLSRYTIRTIFKAIKIKYNFSKLSPHMLRHTLTTTLYNNGANMLFICSILGHSNPSITKRYVHNDICNDLKLFDKYYI